MASRSRSYVDLEVFRYRSGYREINALLAVPSLTPPLRTILIAHDVFGLDEHIEDVAIRFAREGYAVLAPDFYTTKHGPEDDTSTFEGQRSLRNKTADTLAVGDINNGFEWLKTQDYVDQSRVAVVGFGYGGTVALLAAAQNRQLAAAVNFYGEPVYPKNTLSRTKPNSPADMIQYLNCPVLNIYGAADDYISRQDLITLERRFREKGKAFDLRAYPRVANGFYNDSRPEVYNAQTAREVQVLMLNWLDEVLG